MEKPVAIVTPCFNESTIIPDFLAQVQTVISNTNDRFLVVVVDDCSTDDTLAKLKMINFREPHELHILSLQYNVGHQGAIYQGLLYVSELDISRVIIMDSDGEDDPEAIPELLRIEGYSIVEVKRGKRKESLSFRFLYALYKMLFHFITGKSMDYGNYCMINRNIVDRIAHTAFIHLPAYLLKQKASRTSIRYNRQKRIDGKSKMGMQGLLIHAFKSLLEFGEDLLMMFLKLFLVIIVILVYLLGYSFYQKFVTKKAILGWFSTLTVELVNLAMLCFGFFILGILLLNLIHQQNNKTQKSIFKIIKRSNASQTFSS
jgi:glycosyltransferase involved in cell wall biosynthesis